MPPLRTFALLALVVAAAVAVYLFSQKSDIAPPTDATTSRPATTPDVPATAADADGSAAGANAAAEREAADIAPASAAPTAASLTVVGRVVDEQGRPVANATVRSVDRRFSFRGPGRRGEAPAMRQAAPVQTTTGQDGTFRLPVAVVGESTTVRVLARSFRVLDHTLQRPPAGQTDVGTLVLKGAAVVSGRVVDGNGAAIVGARVSRESPRQQPGEPGARPGMPDFGDFEFDFDQFGEFPPGDAPMADADAVEGDFGPPAFVRDLLGGSVTTDAEGRFELLHCEPGDFSLRARHAEHPTARREALTVAAGATLADVVVTMGPGASIRGTVVGAPDPAPKLQVLAAQVRSARPTGPIETPFGDIGDVMGEAMSDFGGLSERSAAVAADGTFAITGLHPGRPYRVWIAQREATFGPSTMCSVKVEVQPPTTNLELRFDPGVTVTFQVVDANRAPIERLWVTDRLRGGGGMEDLMGMMPRGDRVATYPDGRVTLASLRPKKKQTLSLKIEALSFAAFERKDITLPAEGTLDLGVIQLDPAPSLEVVVRAKDSGEPVANARVRITPADVYGPRGGNPFARLGGATDAGPRAATTDAKGICRVNVAANDSFTVRVDTQDFAPYVSPRLVAGAERVHEAMLLRGGTVVAILADAGKASARVRHVTPSEASDSKTTGPDGKVEFTHLQPGRHRFRLADRAGGFDMADLAGEMGGNRPAADEPGWQFVDVVDGATAEVRFTRDPTATLRGIVRENGQPLPRARITFVQGSSADNGAESAENLGAMMAEFGGGAGGRSARAGDDGAYELKNLKAGAHRVRVTASNRAMPAVFDVSLVPGENVLDLALQTAIVRGFVRDPAGAPVAGASVTAAVAAPPKAGADPMADAIGQMMPGVDVGAFAGNQRSVKTGADGSFELRGVQPDTPLQVRASAKPFAASSSTTFQVAANGSQDGVEVRLLAAGKVKVTLAESAPFTSAQARLLAADGTVVPGVPSVVQVLSNGTGTLSGLRAGRWRVDILRPGAENRQSRDVDVVAGETTTVAF